MQKKKIAILTQPLHNNYGGLLQAYALQTVLKRMGHDVWIIDRHHPSIPLWRKIASICFRAVTWIYDKKKKGYSFPFYPTQAQNNIIAKYTSIFVDNNISPRTEKIRSIKLLKQITKDLDFDAYVVGSDQVWRPLYSPCITNYFLDFVEHKQNIKRIAYAASFGVDEWEFTEEETQKCSSLLKKFDAISVREDSGILLCEKYLKASNILHVIDPTLLLAKEDYIKLIMDAKEIPHEGGLMTYILDPSQDKSEIIKRVSADLMLSPFFVQPSQELNWKTLLNIEKCVFPPVTRWLRGFLDADFIIADSFHGCVFSILFNKPFLAISNHNRGKTRFESLLKKFKLADRLIYSMEDLDSSVYTKKIDWEYVNAILIKEREKSFKFLSQLLD